MAEDPSPRTAQPTFPDAFSSYPTLLTSGIGYDPVTGGVWQFQAGNLVQIGTATPEGAAASEPRRRRRSESED